jgi:spore coat polysaccharide biosynthesis predicted glycosyltransferase SpsG/RimJ/RimL family protein N-acetyltransferase
MNTSTQIANPETYLFAFDMDSTSGFGHMTRSLRLASEIQKRGAGVFIAVPPQSIQYVPEMISRGFRPENLHFLQSGIDSGGNGDLMWSAASLKGAFISLGATALVLDSYNFEGTLVSEWRELGWKIILFSDYPTTTAPDFLIDYGFDADVEKYPNFPKEVCLLLGPLFAPLPPTSISERPERAERSVLFCLGGGDYFDLYLDLAQAPQWDELGITPTFVVADLLDPRAVKLSALRGVISPGASLPAIFAKFSLVVSGAGVTLMERLASGSDGIAVVTADNQLHNLRTLSKAANLEIMTLEEVKDFELFFESVSQLLSKPADEASWLPILSQLDGHGVERICNSLIDGPAVTVSLREACSRDVPTLWRWANDGAARLASLTTEPIKPAAHLEWFNSAAGRGESIKICLRGNVPIGVVRLKDEDSNIRLSYSIAPEARGQGLAREMLSIVLRNLLGRRLVASVREENSASNKILLSLGFALAGSNGGVNFYTITPGELTTG